MRKTLKWAAHLPYAVATTLLKEILPVDQAISTSGLKNRVRVVGQELDDHAESAIRGERNYPPMARSRLSPWRWIPHGCATVLLARNKTKPSLHSISLRSDRHPPGDT